MLASALLVLLPGVAALAEGEVSLNLTETQRRELSSPGCQACCYGNDCRLAYKAVQPGVCCGTHPMTGLRQCCPIDASCVRCGTTWKCTRSRYVTRSTQCSICNPDMPPECRYVQHYSYHSGGSSYSFLLMLMLVLFCAIGACAYQRRGYFDDDTVIVQQPPQITGYTPQGQPIYAQPQVVVAQGGYGGGGVASGAAAGFVGGMLVGEALDHGGGYGGGYGGYGGGYGGDYGGMGGGDGGFDAD